MTKNELPVIHPGEFLREILDEMSISQAEFALAIGVSPMRISLIIKGIRPVTAAMALLFGRAFDQSPQYWLNLQAFYDLKIAEAAIGARLTSVLVCPYRVWASTLFLAFVCLLCAWESHNLDSPCARQHGCL